jgi:hypothetical protein
MIAVKVFGMILSPNEALKYYTPTFLFIVALLTAACRRGDKLARGVMLVEHY